MTPEVEALKNLLDDIELPAESYAAVLTDVSMPHWTPRILVWTNRPYDTCPLCGQPVNQDMSTNPPAQLNMGQLESYSQQHGCGQWLDLEYGMVPGRVQEVAGDDVVELARELLTQLHQTRDRQRSQLCQRLRQDLSEALRRIAEPLEPGETPEDRAEEVRTGDEITPGIYREEDEWLAWAYEPGGSDETITVWASDL